MKNKDREFNEELVKETDAEFYKMCCLTPCQECKYRPGEIECKVLFAFDYLGREYKPKKVFSEDEKCIVRNLPEKIKYVARNDNDNVWGFEGKPYKSGGCWYSKSGIPHNLEAFKHLFLNIKREDAEPTTREEILGG